jgi:hypothetical protein
MTMWQKSDDEGKKEQNKGQAEKGGIICARSKKKKKKSAFQIRSVKGRIIRDHAWMIEEVFIGNYMVIWLYLKR